MELEHNNPQPLSFCILFIVLLGILAFGATLKVGFLWDDHEMIVNNPIIKTISISNLKHIFTHDVFEGHGDDYFRPLQSLSYMLDYKIWGLKPFGFHLTNLLLHLANAVLLFFLLSKLFSSQQTGFFSACLFVVHPIIVEQLLIVAGRAELLSACFMLGGILWFIRSPKTVFGPVCLFGFSLLSKESGMAMPFFLGLLAFISPSYRLSKNQLFGFGSILGIYFLIRHWILPVSFFPVSAYEASQSFIRDVPSALIQYVRILLLPFDLHSHRRMLFSMPFGVAALLSWAALFFALVLKKYKSGLFFLGWFLIGFAPKIPLLVTNSLMLDHWAYLSAVSFCGAIGYFVNASHDKYLWANKYSYALFGGLLCLWMLLSAFFSVARSTDEKMYLWALRYPTSSIVRANMGLLYYQQGLYQNAYPLLEQSLQMNFSPGTANVLALTEWKMGEKEKAKNHLAKLIASNPDDFQSRANLALVTGGKEGLQQINEVLSLAPHRIGALMIKATLQASIKDYESSKQTYLRILELDPTNEAARNALESSAHLLQRPHG